MCFPLSQRSLSEPKRTTCPVQADSTPSSTSEEIPELGEEEYEIDCIVNSRFRTARGQCVLEFLIHWKGYAHEDRSWTPASQSEEDDPPVVQFYLKQPGKPGIGQKSPVRGMDMRHFFEKIGGKENVDQRKTPKANGHTKPEAKKAKLKEVPKPAAKKKKAESDESDFVMEDEEEKPSEDGSEEAAVDSAVEKEKAETDDDMASMEVDELGELDCHRTVLPSAYAKDS